MAFEPGRDRAPKTIYSDIFPAAFKRDATVVVKATGKRATIAVRGYTKLRDGKILRAYRLFEAGGNAFTESQIRPANLIDFLRGIAEPANDSVSDTRRAA